jgi:CDP-diacylglycerol--serine O-phosphatidyltransferase
MKKAQRAKLETDRLGEQLYWGVWTIGPWDLHPLTLLFVLSGSLMISTIRIPKL